MSEQADDLLYGMPAIARHLGIKTSAARHLAAKGILPVFNITGVSRICGRRSTLTAWLTAQEARTAHKPREVAA